MLGFLAQLIVLGIVAFAVIGLTKLVYHIVAAMMKVVTALVLAGGVVWIAIAIVRYLAQNPQYLG
jgi:hypothetical protein